MKERSLSSPQFCRSKNMVPACALFCEGSFGRNTCITMGARAKGKDSLARQEDRKGVRCKACLSTTLKRENTFTSSPSPISPESDASGGLTIFYFAPCLQFLSLSHQSAGNQAARTLRPDLDQSTRPGFCIYLRLALMSS